MRRQGAWWPWLVLLPVVLGALIIGVAREPGARTNAERVEALAQRIKCPTCAGQSVADSASASSDAIRAEIARQIEGGRTESEVEAYFASRFGDEILLTPPASGLGGLVWALPVVALVAALAALALAFRRWRDQLGLRATDEDRALVDAALRAERPGADGS